MEPLKAVFQQMISIQDKNLEDFLSGRYLKKLKERNCQPD
jgi:hypothetical protein